MAVDPVTGITIGSKIVSFGKKTFGSITGALGFNNTEAERGSRDQVKSKLLSIGVNRNAWRNFNSNSVKAGTDLYNYFVSNPAAVDYFNRTFSGQDINRANVDAFIANANASLLSKNRRPAMAAAATAAPNFFSGFNIAWILGAVGITAGLYFYQNKKS